MLHKYSQGIISQAVHCVPLAGCQGALGKMKLLLGRVRLYIAGNKKRVYDETYFTTLINIISQIADGGFYRIWHL